MLSAILSASLIAATALDFALGICAHDFQVSAPASARGGWLWGPGSTSSTSAPPSPPPPPLTAAEIAYREEQNREAMIEALGAACRRGL